MAQEGLGGLLHLGENHGGDLLGEEALLLTLVFHRKFWLSINLDHLKWPVLHVRLDGRVAVLSPDQPLGIKDSVGGVHGYLVLGGVPNKPLGISEGNIAGGGSVALVIGNDLDLAMLEDADAGEGSSGGKLVLMGKLTKVMLHRNNFSPLK